MYPEFMWYEAAGYGYWLLPELWDVGDKVHLVGAKMYDKAGNYVGYWPNNTMPKKLAQTLLKHGRLNPALWNQRAEEKPEQT